MTAIEIKLQAIENALERIGEGEYGICEDCEEEIAQARLEALPFRPIVCVACQEEREKEARFQRRIDDGGGFGRSNQVDLDDS